MGRVLLSGGECIRVSFLGLWFPFLCCFRMFVMGFVYLLCLKSLDPRHKHSGMTGLKREVAGYPLEACWYDGFETNVLITL